MNEFSLPLEAERALADLGHDLALARRRRKETQDQWAQRLGVSKSTLRRMESGDPAVGVGVYAGALWLIGRAMALTGLAAPEHDRQALGVELERLERNRSRHSRVSR